MTSTQARWLYRQIADAENVALADSAPGEWAEIEEAMRQVVAAANDSKAANVIRWWDNFDPKSPNRYYRSALACARHLRQLAAGM